MIGRPANRDSPLSGTRSESVSRNLYLVRSHVRTGSAKTRPARLRGVGSSLIEAGRGKDEAGIAEPPR